MAVKKQNTTRGETKFYHYRFMSRGKLYQGVCKGCTTEKAALKYEKDVKEKVNELAKQKSVKALVENFRQEITGGSDILLANTFEEFLKKPRKKLLSDKNRKYKEACWRDFVAFLNDGYPDIEKLADVRKSHAEEYIQYIRDNGRFDKSVSFKKGNKVSTYKQNVKSLSNRSCNAFQIAIAEIFDKLQTDAGLIENPFSSIPKLNNETESREAFTEDELKLIAEKADNFIKPIFIIGIATALREGDICTLKWSEVDLSKNLITRKMDKTRRTVEIPILPPLRGFLVDQQVVSGSYEYVLPEHARMYLSNQSGITWRVKSFLESIGIKTVKKVSGRSRAVSIKDVHSLRHTFCYYAGVYGIPFLVVKDIVGHVSPQMTELYQKHADNRVKREKLMLMPDFMGLDAPESPRLEFNSERQELMSLIDILPDESIPAAVQAIKVLLLK